MNFTIGFFWDYKYNLDFDYNDFIIQQNGPGDMKFVDSGKVSIMAEC